MIPIYISVIDDGFMYLCHQNKNAMKEIKCLLILFVMISGIVSAQEKVLVGNNKDTNKVEKLVYLTCDGIPSFPGGDKALFAYLDKNLHYPKKAKESNIQGTVFIRFIIDEDGKICNVKLMKGIAGGAGCNEEAVRVIKLMPDWIPGKEGGKNVAVYYNIPIKFALSGDGPPTDKKKTTK